MVNYKIVQRWNHVFRRDHGLYVSCTALNQADTLSSMYDEMFYDWSDQS